MARTQTMVQLSDELVTALDEVAADRGVSRSALVRELVTTGLADVRRDVIGAQIAEGYRRIPQGTPDEWGDLLAAGDRAADDLMARLDAEERAAGHGPW